MSDKDTIYRQDAIRDIHSMDVCVIYDDACSTEEAVEKAIVATKRTAIFGLECMPSAEPRKKGKWIDKSDGIDGAWNYCSVCMEQAIDLYDFCPNCGADMREDT